MGNTSMKQKNENLETFSLVWLDNLVNNSAENLKVQQQLRTLINHLKIFEDEQRCLQYIHSVPNEDRIVLIVSGRLGRIIIPKISNLRQIASIYIYCMDKQSNQQWAQHFPKVKGIFVQLNEIIHQIQINQTKQGDNRINESLSVSILKSNMIGEGQSLTELNGQFLYSELLINCLIRMKPLLNEKDELISICKQLYGNNPSELNIVKEFEKDYTPERSLWWYTRQSFVYRLLNKALRVQNIDVLYLFRFFVRDIKWALEKNKCLAPIRVYRVQLMSKNEIQTLKENVTELISINSFISTSLNRESALDYLTKSSYSNNLESVFFEIDANPQLSNVKPFSNITSLSYFPSEEEVLFMIGSSFRLVNIYRDQKGIWNIKMTLCSDNDHQLQSLSKHMHDELGSGVTNLLTFGHILKDMGRLNDARKYYSRYLNQLPKIHQHASSCCHGLGVIADKKGDLQSSLKWYTKSLEIAMQTLSKDHPNIATTHNSIGEIYRKKRDYSRALESYHKTLVIFKKAYGEDHPHVATCYSNIGIVHKNEKQYSIALKCYTKALLIRQKCLPDNHPELGQSYNNIGTVYRCLGQYDLALNYLNLSLTIKSDSLPSQHSDIASTLANIGLVYEQKKEFQHALSYYQKAIAIYRHSFPATHPHVTKIQQMINRVSPKPY